MLKETNLNRYNFIEWVETYIKSYASQDVEFARLQVLKTKLGRGRNLSTEYIESVIETSFEVIIREEKVLEMKKAFLFGMEKIDADKIVDNSDAFSEILKMAESTDMDQSLKHLMWLDERMRGINSYIKELKADNEDQEYVLKKKNESYMSLITEMLTMFN